jgi:CRISPR system Cascade subunit CasB
MIRNKAAVAEWWHAQQPRPPAQSGDRAALARLRRCATVAQAMQDPATISLFRRAAAGVPADLPPIALAAAVLAHVREDVPEMTVARQIGPESPDMPETALLKPLRFRRLMEAETYDERLTAFRRLVAITGGRLNVTGLADALLDWPEWRRQRWTYDYWNAGLVPGAASRSAKEIAV